MGHPDGIAPPRDFAPPVPGLAILLWHGFCYEITGSFTCIPYGCADSDVYDKLGLKPYVMFPTCKGENVRATLQPSGCLPASPVKQ
jgi:hypothetical protein